MSMKPGMKTLRVYLNPGQEGVVTCPHCATAKSEIMPIDACQFFYTCSGCGATRRPKPGDCCVFCSYGSVPCPPIQAERMGEVGAASCCAGSPPWQAVSPKLTRLAQ